MPGLIIALIILLISSVGGLTATGIWYVTKSDDSPNNIINPILPLPKVPQIPLPNTDDVDSQNSSNHQNDDFDFDDFDDFDFDDFGDFDFGDFGDFDEPDFGDFDEPDFDDFSGVSDEFEYKAATIDLTNFDFGSGSTGYGNDDTTLNSGAQSDETDVPVDGYWTDWSEWRLIQGDVKKCDTEYTIRRYRKCHKPSYGGAACQGEATETEIKKTGACRPTWSKWDVVSGTCTACAFKKNEDKTGRFREGILKVERACTGDVCGGKPVGYKEFKEVVCASSGTFCSYMVVGDELRDSEILVSKEKNYFVRIQKGRMIKLPRGDIEKTKQNSWVMPSTKLEDGAGVVLYFSPEGLSLKNNANGSELWSAKFTGAVKVEIDDNGIFVATDSENNVVWDSSKFPEPGSGAAPPDPSDIQIAAAVMDMIPGLHMIPGMGWMPSPGEKLLWTAGAGEDAYNWTADAGAAAVEWAGGAGEDAYNWSAGASVDAYNAAADVASDLGNLQTYADAAKAAAAFAGNFKGYFSDAGDWIANRNYDPRSTLGDGVGAVTSCFGLC
jgi:hypothetical protein